MPSGCGQSLRKPPVISLGPHAHPSPAPPPSTLGVSLRKPPPLTPGLSCDPTPVPSPPNSSPNPGQIRFSCSSWDQDNTVTTCEVNPLPSTNPHQALCPDSDHTFRGRWTVPTSLLCVEAPPQPSKQAFSPHTFPHVKEKSLKHSPAPKLSHSSEARGHHGTSQVRLRGGPSYIGHGSSAATRLAPWGTPWTRRHISEAVGHSPAPLERLMVSGGLLQT